VKQHNIKQYEGELPAELIVTGYKHQHDLDSSKPKLKLMNYVGETPKKDTNQKMRAEEEQDSAIEIRNNEILLDDEHDDDLEKNDESMIEAKNAKVFDYGAK